MVQKWPTKKLGEICEKIISGDWGTEKEKSGLLRCKVIRGTDFVLVQNGTLSELPDRYIEIERFENIKLKPGDILIEISGGSRDQPTGRILFWNRKETIPIIFSNFVKKILLKTEIIEPKFFFRYWQFLYFKGITKNYEERTTNIRNFKLKEFLENEEIPLPPLPIQQKIVKILDTIQLAVEIQEKIIEKTKELKKSLMNLLFHYGLAGLRVKELASSRVGELTSSEIEKLGLRLKKTEIGEIPEDWEVVRLGDKIERPQYGITASAIEEDTGIKLLRITDIQEEKVDWNSVPFCKCTKDETEKYQLKDGDIVIARIGATTGKSYFVKNAPKSVFGSYLIRIRAKNSLDPVYLSYYFQTDIYWFQLNLAKGGKLKGGINIPLIENLKIPLPPLPEQQEIAEILQTIDQKIEIEKKKKELYEELFKTMLNKIMSQEIDVNLLDY
jgi:type I restriction enzyme S subunit